MHIVTISGLDGSGKSTQIKLLKDFLESQHMRVYYFHAVSFSLANRLFNYGRKSLPGETKAVTKANPLSIWLRSLILIIDCWRFTILCCRLKSHYDYLLSDRYFYDQVVNIQYLKRHQPPVPASWWQKIVDRCIIKPHTAFYLRTTPDEILKRERLVEQGKDYLYMKSALYEEYSKKHELRAIHGNRRKEEISNEIISYLQF